MIIGIELKNRQPDVFYCGTDAVAFRKKHAELVAQNTDGKSRFFSITHPLLTPLDSVTHSREDHPDQIEALKKRDELAKSHNKKATQTEIKTDSTSKEKTPKKEKNK